MRASWLSGLLSLAAVIAAGWSGAEAAHCLAARKDASPRIVSYGDVGAFVRYGQPALRGFVLAGQPLADPGRVGALTYAVVDMREEAILGGVRMIIGVQLSREASGPELWSIGDELIRHERAGRRLNAIAVVYHLAGAVTADACALGIAVWAPNGNWDAARTVRLGDYTRHRLVLDGADSCWQERAASVMRSGAAVAHPCRDRPADATP